MQTFEWAYKKYRDIVFRFAIRCVGRREVAEELTADAFLLLHQRWTSIDVEKLPSWLFTVVKNRAIDHWRGIELERRYSAPKAPARQSGETTAGLEPEALFENAALKPVHRICLTLHYVHEMTVAEIAERLGLKELQVKGHLQYARILLRKQFSAETPQ